MRGYYKALIRPAAGQASLRCRVEYTGLQNNGSVEAMTLTGADLHSGVRWLTRRSTAEADSERNIVTVVRRLTLNLPSRKVQSGAHRLLQRVNCGVVLSMKTRVLARVERVSPRNVTMEDLSAIGPVHFVRGGFNRDAVSRGWWII